MKTILKTSPAKFKVTTPGVTSSELELDFNPIIQEFKLKGNFTLILNPIDKVYFSQKESKCL